MKKKIVTAANGVMDKINSIAFLKKTPEKKSVVIAFGLLIVVIALVSGAFVLAEKRGDEGQTTASAESSFAVKSAADYKELKANFLFVLNDEDVIKLLCAVRLNSDQGTARVAFIDPDTQCTVNNIGGSMHDHLRNGGIKELLWAVGEYANISIERYIIGDEGDFTALMRHMGDIETFIEENVVYSHDGLSFIIEKGDQALTPDMMLKYFLYLCENQPGMCHKIAEMMALYAETLFFDEDGSKIDSSFSALMSTMETNISALDLAEYKATVLALAQSDILSSVIIEGDVSTLK